MLSRSRGAMRPSETFLRFSSRRARDVPAHLLAGCSFLLVLASGCAISFESIDVRAVVAARAGVEQFDNDAESEPYPRPSDEDIDRGEEQPRARRSAFLGTLLAIFPGLLVPGTGHYYAGDRKTARQLFRVGETGLVLTAVGGGLVVGGIAAGESDLVGTSISLYVTGGGIAGIGLTYLLSAWIYDIIDTPRAARSGGRPPPRTPFVEGLDIFAE